MKPTGNGRPGGASSTGRTPAKSAGSTALGITSIRPAGTPALSRATAATAGDGTATRSAARTAHSCTRQCHSGEGCVVWIDWMNRRPRQKGRASAAAVLAWTRKLKTVSNPGRPDAFGS